MGNDTWVSTSAAIQQRLPSAKGYIHATTAPIRDVEDLADADERLRELLFLDLLDRGYYIAGRGYLALSLAVTDDQLDGFIAAVDEAASRISHDLPSGVS